MAKRILSADSALLTNRQTSLTTPSLPDTRGGLLPKLRERWENNLSLDSEQLLFNWEDQRALKDEITFVNNIQSALDEAAIRIAPSLLRIVLTVKENIPSPKAQKEFMAENLNLDFRRISELCIAADSYGLLIPGLREDGRKEIVKYGWSKALKLAYVRNAEDRNEIWERACAGKPSASYRAVLEELRRFRERKLIAPPAPFSEIGTRMGTAREKFSAFENMTENLNSRQDFQEALNRLGHVSRELNLLKRALRDSMESVETESLAATA